MEASFVSVEQRTSKAKTLAIVALAVVGTFAACFLLFNGASSVNMVDVEAEIHTDPVVDVWMYWKLSNNITYGGAEEATRYNNFKVNYGIVNEHNSANKSYTLTLNKFAAMTLEEFAATHLGVNPKKGLIGQVQLTRLDDSNLPDSVDWSAKGAVTAIKNQGQCGSCWAFSTTGSLEGLYFQKTGDLVSFSEQDLVDCSGSYGNEGCNGGLMDNAFKYVLANGIATEADYPYEGVDGTCKTDVNRTKFLTENGYKDVIADSPSQLEAAIVNGPVSVAIEADTSVFQLFNKGVITSDACGDQLDHGVLAVGYGTLAGKKYYKVKNSWGADWGLAGYVNIGVENGEGVCGIQMSASYPVDA